MTTLAARFHGLLTMLASVLVSIVGWTYLAVSGVVLFPIAMVIWLVTLPFDRNLVALHLFTCWWAAMYIYVHPGWRLRIEGRGKLPWKGAAILVPNHQSMIDALVMFALYRPFKPVTKTAVQWVPIFGWNLMLNRYIRLARGERKSIARMAADCRYWLRRGMPVMIYPEGTRSPDGQIKDFKNGAFTLAVEENCPVYPIVIDGTPSALAKHGALLGLRATMVARVLDPIYPNAPELGDPRCRSRDRVMALREHVRQIMIQQLAQLRAELSGSGRCAASIDE